MITLSGEVLAIRRVPVLLPSGIKTHSVAGSDGLPIPDVESYLGYLRATGHSPNTCTPFFRTTPTFLPIHIRQRDETLRQLDLARQDGRQRAVDAHEKTLDRLNTIIDGLEKEKTGTSRDQACGS